jgi:hypothetical protein
LPMSPLHSPRRSISTLENALRSPGTSPGSPHESTAPIPAVRRATTSRKSTSEGKPSTPTNGSTGGSVTKKSSQWANPDNIVPPISVLIVDGKPSQVLTCFCATNWDVAYATPRQSHQSYHLVHLHEKEED